MNELEQVVARSAISYEDAAAGLGDIMEKIFEA